MTPENSSALLRKYSPSPGEKFPFLRPADTGFPRALGWSFFTLFLFDSRSYIMYSDASKKSFPYKVNTWILKVLE
jgi:hypothetical protein